MNGNFFCSVPFAIMDGNFICGTCSIDTATSVILGSPCMPGLYEQKIKAIQNAGLEHLPHPFVIYKEEFDWIKPKLCLLEKVLSSPDLQYIDHSLNLLRVKGLVPLDDKLLLVKELYEGYGNWDPFFDSIINGTIDFWLAYKL